MESPCCYVRWRARRPPQFAALLVYVDCSQTNPFSPSLAFNLALVESCDRFGRALSLVIDAFDELYVRRDARRFDLLHALAVRRGDGRAPRALRVASVLLVPIQRDDRLLGVLVVDEPGVERTFTLEEQALAAALVDQAVVAIDNALAIGDSRRRSDELTALFRLGIALSQELTPEGVVDLQLEQVHRLMDVDSAVVARLHSPDSLHCDVLDAGRRLPALSVPLVARGEVIGAVSVRAESPFRFQADHLRLLQMIANRTAIALDNARLLQTARHRAEELRLVNEIG